MPWVWVAVLKYQISFRIGVGKLDFSCWLRIVFKLRQSADFFDVGLKLLHQNGFYTLLRAAHIHPRCFGFVLPLRDLAILRFSRGCRERGNKGG